MAIDFDGTLTKTGTPDPAVLAAVAEARASGLRVVLVTGRILDELRAVFPDVEGRFDAIVAENGAVLLTPSGVRRLAVPVTDELTKALANRGITARHGEVLVACAGRDEHAVLDEIRRLGLEDQLIRNRGELMVLPSGISKGNGLLEALGELGLSHHNTVAVGDAENDHSLLEVAEIGVTVANAVPSLKQQADLVLDDCDGIGVARLLRGNLLTDQAGIQPGRWYVTLGVDDNGVPAHLAAAQLNILIAGGTGDGKSYLAGLIAEQLIGLGYSLVVVDPEGDHVGLSELRGVLVVGGDRHLPPPSAVVPLLRHRYATVIVDLSHLDNKGQSSYLESMPAEIEAHRRITGLPHWVIIDEAHRSIGHHGLALSLFDRAVKGHCLVTFQPASLAADALAVIDVVLALTNPRPDRALVEMAATVAELPRVSMAELLSVPTGHVVLAARQRAGHAITIQPAARGTAHFRHQRKYSMVGTDADRRFYFRAAPEWLAGATAANLSELETELARCERAVLRHHCQLHDFSRWVANVFHDRPLAETLRPIEATIGAASPAAVVEAGRLELIAALQARTPG